jgi:hypothetical protein
VVLWNPHSVQPYGFYSPWKGRSLFVRMEPGVPLSRRLRLPPGDYRVSVTADGPVDIALGGQAVVSGEPVTVARFPRLEISAPAVTKLRGITIRERSER